MSEQTQVGPGAELNVPSVPVYSGSNFQVIASDKEIVVMVGITRVGFDADGAPGPVNSPSVQLTLPTPAAKELALLLNEGVSRVESEFGVVNTAFLRERAGL